MTETTFAHRFDRASCRHFLEEMPITLHCHHFTNLTTRAAMEVGFADGRAILREVAEAAFLPIFTNLFRRRRLTDSAARLDLGTRYFSYIGLGKIAQLAVDQKGGSATLSNSHLDEGWKSSFGAAKEPINFIGRGVLAALAAAAHDLPIGTFQVTETESIATGAAQSKFSLKRQASSAPTPIHFPQVAGVGDPAKVPSGSIDRAKVIDSLSPLVGALRGNEQGLIPAFGVLLNMLPVTFWNGFAYRIMSAAHNQGEAEIIQAARFLLRQAGHECGYHTGYGIITSPEWKAAVEPMIKNAPADVLHGAFAVFTAWGWAKSWVDQLEPGTKMVVQASEYYEADGARYEPSAFMIEGVSGGFFDLAYGAAYPDGLGYSLGTQQTGLECGDPSATFLIEKSIAKVY